MKRILVAVMLLVTIAPILEPAFAARRVVVKRGAHRRTTVVVHRGWPLRRPLRAVVVRPARTVVRVVPGLFLAPVVFSAAALASAPRQDLLVWQDGETLSKREDWTEFTLNCDARGTNLWLEVKEGKVQADWAEVVFENGDVQVVDFNERIVGIGLYPLLDFKDGRKVDHVRMVARARTNEARVELRLEK